METFEANQLLIKQLLSRKDDLKLPQDVSFVFELDDGKRTVEMSAEKMIAAVDNEQFAEVFDISVKRESTPEIRVVAIEQEQFISLLGFVYSGKLELANLHSTYAAAQYYGMQDICEALIKYADSKLSIDNSTILLDQYCKIAGICDKKISEVTGIINLHAFVAVHSKEFLKIDKSTLIRLLKSDQLFIQEKDLYFAVLRWMNAELKLQGLEANLENKSKLFNEFKPLIRFPIMSKHQFFTAERKNRFTFESKQTFEVCPAKSGLFSQAELDEFEQYFETKDAAVLSIGYSTDERAGMKIGVLKLVQNEQEKPEYRMLTNFDELHRKAEPRDDFENCTLLNYLPSNCYLDADVYLEDCGSSYRCVYDAEYEKIKTKPITAKARGDDLVCGTNSIRVFRIDVTGSSSHWDYGEHLRIESDMQQTNYYKRYSIDHTFGYYDYWPSIELKKNNTYTFRFICPGEGEDATKMKLDNVYTKAENGELVPDVKLRIIGGLAWAHPTFIYFLYK